MIGLAESFRARLKQHPLPPSSIRLGAADSFAMLHLSPLLSRIAELYPGTRVDLDIDFSANLERKLEAAELDLPTIGL